ncbi:hypothetical protein CK203_042144 [Vitis vinifera]|uniref:Uncharacterized protein n=1 Tax=Vitis vinifera TaxID=29760 RepID=A0A438HPW6_VITVI|nr:hypothetical protein CK203_042144 [Vitis vinifera]
MCGKLHKKPQNLKQINNKGGNQPTRLGQANHTVIVEEKPEQVALNKSSIERLKQLLNQLENSNANSSSNSGSYFLAQSVSLGKTIELGKLKDILYYLETD